MQADGTASPAALQGAAFTGTLWAAITTTGGTGPARTHRHLRGAYDPEWLSALPLPIGPARPPTQPVALLDDRDRFERHADAARLSDAYMRRPRTQVSEHINFGQPDTWYSLAARHLGRLTGSRLEVTCSVFVSAVGDESLPAHHDTWYGAIVQMDGAKTWATGHCLPGSHGDAQEVTTRAGDILLLPKGLPHAARTPADPGRSVHITFAIHRDDDSRLPGAR
jgi:hypothetical protein